MASLKGAAAEYALTRDAQGKVSTTRPGARVIIPFSEKDRITAVRKSVKKSNKAGLGAERLRAPGSPSC